RGAQPEAIELVRPEIVRNAPCVFQRLGEDRGDDLEMRLSIAGAAQRKGSAILRDEEPLADRIVELTGNPLALDLLTFDEPSGELGLPLLYGFQSEKSHANHSADCKYDEGQHRYLKPPSRPEG